MLRIIIRSIVALIFLSIIFACNGNPLSGREDLFLQQMPGVEFNTRIKFWSPKPSEVFIRGEHIFLTLENLSKEKIIFPGDYGIRILSFDEDSNKWIEIRNTMVYLPPGNAQISPKGPDEPSVIGVGLSPDLTKDGPPTEVRIVVIGVEENSSDRIGAYIDVTLQPQR